MSAATLNVIEIISVVLVTPAFLTMCWKVAAFAISAKKDIANILEVIRDMKEAFRETLTKHDDRITELEHKEIARAEREKVWQGGDS